MLRGSKTKILLGGVLEIENPSLLVNFLTMLILSASMTIAILQLRALRRQMKGQHEWNRRVTALSYTFSKDPMLRDIRHRLDKALELRGRTSGEISLNEILSLQKTYPSIITDLQIVLGRLENMAIGIKHQVCDEEICKDMLRGAVVRYYRRFCQYIDDVRKKQENPHIYENLEYHAKKWSAKEVETREPTG